MKNNNERENLKTLKKIQEVEIEVLPPLLPSESLVSNFQVMNSTDLQWVNPCQLKPHPRNTLIYGQDEDVSDLVELIERSQWVKPLVITSAGTIISGHRRWKAALSIGLESVPVEVRAFLNEIAELEALLLENANRVKTTEQKVREAKIWEEVESVQAKQRQVQLAGTRPNTQSDLVANLPQGNKGKTRDYVATKVGMKARTYEKATKVVNLIDSELDIGNQDSAQGLRRILNEQSVDAAYQLLKYDDERRSAILEKIMTGKAKTPSQAAKSLKTTLTETERIDPKYPYPTDIEKSTSEKCPPPPQKIEIDTNEILIAFTSNLEHLSTVQIKTVANSLAQYYPDKAIALLEAIAQQDKRLAEAFVKAVLLVYPEIISEVSP